MTRLLRLCVVVVLPSISLAAGCQPQLDSGHFACSPGDPSTCPAFWLCLPRGLGDARCYDPKNLTCGDGTAHGSEECDGLDQGGQSCTTIGAGFTGGALGCTSDCRRTHDRCLGPDTNWATMPSPTQADLHGLAGSRGGSLFAVGDKGTVLKSDGATWIALDSTVTDNLAAAWSGSPQDLVAAGAAILHYDGTSFTRIVGGPSESAWGSGADNVLLGGAGDILRFDGHAASPCSATPPACPEPGAKIFGLWGFSATDVLAVGAAGEGKPIVLHGDGVSWTKLDPSVWAALGQSQSLTSVWGSSATHVFAVAQGGAIFHFDGRVWARVPQLSPATALHGVWGRSPFDVYAVGNGGVVQHYDGVSFTPMRSGTTASLAAVWSDGERGVYTAGSGGTILRFAAASSPQGVGACAPAIPLYCNQGIYFGDTIGAPAHIDTYPCASRKLAGAEVSYRFDSPRDGRVRIQLTPHAFDLDLVVVGADEIGGCDVKQCLADSGQGGLATESIDLQVARGKSYYVEVDGVAAAQIGAGYTLTVDCQPR